MKKILLSIFLYFILIFQTQPEAYSSHAQEIIIKNDYFYIEKNRNQKYYWTTIYGQNGVENTYREAYRSAVIAINDYLIEAQKKQSK